MIYAQFYKLSTGYVAGTIPPQFRDDCRRPIPCVGSDGVLPLDGRLARRNMAARAREIGRRLPGVIGFTLNAGPSFTQSREVRPLELFEKESAHV